MATTGRIDTHNHLVPAGYPEYLAAYGITTSGGGPLPKWSQGHALAVMDARSVTTAILSVSAPGVHVGDGSGARAAARMVNEAAAEIVRNRPDRFGFFATLTLPDVEGALVEMAYAFDTLHADGIIVLANSRGKYLGDASFAPLFAEFDRRRAIVFVHPAELPGPAAPGIAPFAADFLLDTTRTAIDLCRTGTMERYPNMKVILAHAGGFVPFSAYRMAPMCSPDFSAADGLASLKRFYFDLAVSSSPSALPSLLAFAEPDRVTFGSDSPFAPDAVVETFAEYLEQYSLEDAERHSIDRGAAEVLFPRLALARA